MLFLNYRVRRKRDFIYSDTDYKPDSGSENVARHAELPVNEQINSIQRDVPVLPFSDPLYKEQWYLVRFFFVVTFLLKLLISKSIDIQYLTEFFSLKQKI